MSKDSEYPTEKLAKFFAKLSPNQSQYSPASSHGEVIFLTEGLTSPTSNKLNKNSVANPRWSEPLLLFYLQKDKAERMLESGKLENWTLV